MDKYLTQRNLIIAGSIIALAVIGFVIYKRVQNKHKLEGEPEVQGEDTSIVPTVVYSSTWPLKQGSGRNEGEKALVRTVQKYLNKMYPYGKGTLTVDGIFGPETLEDLLYYTGKSEVSEADFNRMLSVVTGTKL